MRVETGNDMGKQESSKTATSAAKTVGKPFEKGHDPRRNLDGRPPKGQAIADIYREILDAEEVEFRIWKDGEEKTQMLRGQPTIRHRMGLVLLGMAMSGDIAAIREMSDRTEGKVAAANAQIEATATGGDGKDMKVTITVVGSDRDIDV